MDHLLNLSTAAKLVGVSRGAIQSKIKKGELETFEGHIRMSSLCKTYPELEDKTDPVLERMSRIREFSTWEAKPSGESAEQLLSSQVHHLKVELQDAYAKINTYELLFETLNERLSKMREDCDRKEKQNLNALLNWISTQM